ncbi:membrane protein [Actibacterium mucosum KCTC 23349]|uniref:Membrane protein n=1 Tax=Actibacterium mucosum KCTC 23349 TaxID=1454373 RepID=A0A037ZD51_9RHOB|nr:OmpA family protein [Actibacterium mucosum]KAJ54082.1 membrane protein [Actibacterium mucosum KCTC 23349]
MTNFKLIALTTTAALALSACTPNTIADFYRPAGDDLDTGSFGNPTMNNIQVMTGELNAIINLTRKFADEAPATINFAFDSAALDAEAQAALRQQAAWIKEYNLARFRVYGHTDKVGSDGYNRSLGLRRARAAVNFLVAQGIDRSRLEAVVSFGETQPLVLTENRERKNRRTVTEVSGFIKPRDQILDGKYGLFVYDEYRRSATETHVDVPFDPEASREER